MVVISLAGTAWWVNAKVDRPVSQAKTSTIFTVAKGQGVQAIAKNLADHGFLTSAPTWTIYIITSGLRASLLPGEYPVSPSMTGREIARLLTTDQTSFREVTVKIIEGSSANEIAGQLEKANVISADDFLAAVKVPDSRILIPDRYYEFLTDKLATAGLEGFLFPDTYRFFQHSTKGAVLKKFLDNFNVKFKTDTRQQIKAKGQTYFETVIMASILEAEMKTDTDRAMAADIFWRRFNAHIALQADATVNYALGRDRVHLSNTDLQVDSLYNTYKYPGLPPGPIGNPGISSLRAAANPKPNDYWYYLTGSDGKTHYAKTLDEHNRNKQLYL